MFIDSVEIKLISGKGGDGVVSWRREKFVPLGGPDGGNGGKGGDIIFEVDKNSHTLANFRGRKILKAQRGENGKSKNCTGKNGENLIIKVPPGTQVIDSETQELLLDLTQDGERVLFLKGGKGGLGNQAFKSARNQQPKKATPGKPGQEKIVRLEVKLISDIALVGFPNVGKSSLISAISNAKPEIANYEFTTLTPKLGTVTLDYTRSFVVADIPGIIEGASDGKGLGIEFLKHIERSRFLLFLLDISNYRNLEEQYFKLRQELKNFSETLFQRDFGIAITKIDIFPDDEVRKIVQHFNDEVQHWDTPPKFVLPISSVANIGLDELNNTLYKHISN